MPSKRRPLVAFGLIVALILTQIGWWIYYQLDQNKTVFKLHQSLLSHRVREAVQFLNHSVETGLLEHALAAENSGGEIRRESPLGHFVTSNDTTFLYTETAGVVVNVINWPGLIHLMQSRYPDLTVERLPQTRNEIYKHGPARHVRLPILVRPKTEYLGSIIREAERKSLMFISEGVFLSCMVLFGVFVIYSSLRRELRMETRQKNFILSITHELKSPLASIKLYLQTMLSKKVPETKRTDFLEHSIGDIGRLERLIENMLEAARFESGGYKLIKSPVSISDVVLQLVRRVENSPHDEPTQIEHDIETGLWVVADPHALHSIVDNIMDNAIKYSLPPKVIGVRLFRNNGEAVLRITDSGPGIADGDRLHLFERFYRAGDEMTRRSKGSGLGLFLAKQFADAHKASITVKNGEDRGAIFEVRFALNNPKENGGFVR